MATAIVWFRRDLRVDDNPSLQAAADSGGAVMCAATADPAVELGSPRAPARLAFWLEGLADLDRRLADAGGGLVLVEDAAGIAALAEEVGAAAVYTHADWQPDEAARLRELETRLTDARRALVRTAPQSVLLPEEVVNEAGAPPRTYSSWLRIAERALAGEERVPERRSLGGALLRPPRRTEPPTLKALGVVDVERDQRGGEAAALERLRRYRGSGGLEHYADRRNDLDDAFASARLSAYLELGMLSRRRVLAVAARARARKLRQELLWRDFMDHTLAWHPDMREHAIDRRYDRLEWPGTDEAFAAWTAGETGFGLVDAGIRQLRATGFLPNRVRMVVASCLTKTLHVDWRRGERFFREHLVDGSWAVNAGNWQWVTGCGLDAAPYFRILNPQLQAAKFDPDGTYQDRWAPDRPAEPIVDHKRERERTLALYQAALA